MRQTSWESNPRKKALEAIIELYPTHPQTLPLLSDRAENDPDELLSKFAQESIRELENTNPNLTYWTLDYFPVRNSEA
ncbi:hypothetical protein RIVM261_079120 [Rivularia sp. IAM M-261]|nr:hypothetical protein RIVM261_079120 [Rivularia sp. IAM M-261]